MAKRLENGLFYSDDDILLQYRESKNKKEQLKILAEMNLCTIEVIRQTLIRAGLDYRSLPRTGKNEKKQNIKNQKYQPKKMRTVIDNANDLKIENDNNTIKHTNQNTEKPSDAVVDNSYSKDMFIDYILDANISYKNILLEKISLIKEEISELDSRSLLLKNELEKYQNQLLIAESITTKMI